MTWAENAWNWLAGIIAALAGAVWGALTFRIRRLEERVELHAKSNDVGHNRLYDRIDSLRLEVKNDCTSLIEQMDQRFDKLDRRMNGN